MFAGDGAAAFCKASFASVMVSEIVAWWRAVGDRLDAAIPVHGNRTAVLAPLDRHDARARETVAVEPCAGGWCLVRRPYPESLPSLRA